MKIKYVILFTFDINLCVPEFNYNIIIIGILLFGSAIITVTSITVTITTYATILAT